MHQVVKVGLPVPLGIEVEREAHAGELAREAPALRIDGARPPRPRSASRRSARISAAHPRAEDPARAASSPSSTSPRPWRLAADWARAARGPAVELLVQDRVARRILVDVGGAVADPLPRHEDRQLHMELDLAHLEGCGVPVTHQIVDQAAILADLPGAPAVGDARRLDDRAVVAHVVDDADEAVVEHRQSP